MPSSAPDQLPVPVYAGPERRKWVRIQANSRARGALAITESVRLAVARVVNISMGGARLIVRQPPQEGGAPTLTLTRRSSPVIQRAGRIVYASPVPDGSYAVGVAFSTKLGLQELGGVL